MSGPALSCHHDARRDAVRAAELNGFDYLEVSPDQLTLTVYFLGKAPSGLVAENLRIEGGDRIRDIRIEKLRIHRHKDPEMDDRAEVTVDRYGDFSTYQLRAVALDEEGEPTDAPMAGFDPRYDRLAFSFKADCPSELDCKSARPCPPPPRPVPAIDYLAKDYASFRRVLFDRLSQVLPDWKERHAPDLGVALVEALAYVGDHLSYYQDAVATEAYLDTARQRVSVRRHARLIDYAMHEGVNARAWLTLEVSADEITLPPEGFPAGSFDFFFVTGWDNMPPPGAILTLDDLPAAAPYEVFEPVTDFVRHPIRLCRANNRIEIYDWQDRQCCLPRGATRATLVDPGVEPPDEPDDEVQKGRYREDPAPTGDGGDAPARLESPGEPAESTDSGGEADEVAADEPDGEWRPAYHPPPPGEDLCEEEEEEEIEPRHALCLAEGDVLIFEEVKGPETGEEADADPAHRHAVRLTRVEPTVDPLNGQLLVEVEWAPEDALPFPLCVSSLGRAPDCELIEGVSVARGNVVLVDHGARFEDEPLEPAPPADRRWRCEDECRAVELEPRHPIYRPRLDRAPTVFAEPYDPRRPACATLDQDPRRALPWIRLWSGQSDALGEFTPEHEWRPRRDLLASRDDDRHFVLEVDNEGHGQLRFGDGELGRRPPAGGEFRATYRVGRGPDGNVGPEAIRRIVLRRGTLEGETIAVRNPLAARGGTAREPIADVKRLAPSAWTREPCRAITAEDYAALATAHPAVERAVARLRWAGCSYKVQVAVDPRGRKTAPPELLDEVAARLAPYRRLGHEVVVGPARYVALDVAIGVCVLPDYQRGDVAAALTDALGNRVLADGSRGFFHPDELTFGEGVFLSALTAAAQRVAGVESVVVIRFHRLYEAPNGEIGKGLLELGPFEIARLDNDPSLPENGRLRLDLRGGR